MHKKASHDLYTWEIFLIYLTNEAIHDIIKETLINDCFRRKSP